MATMAADCAATFGSFPAPFVCGSSAIASSSLAELRSAFLPFSLHRSFRSVVKPLGRCKSPRWRIAAVAGMAGAEEVAEQLVKGAMELTAEGGPGWGSTSLLLPVLLWYTTAAPGSVSGLLDFLSAPVHATMQPTFLAEEVELGRQLGEGSFGVAYEGYVGKKGRKKDERLHVVMKKAKAKVAGASEVQDAEVYMNHRVKRTAPGACADFLGTVEVGASQVKGKLTEGLWLLWRFQGDRTLDHYMKQRNFPENISEAVLGARAMSDKGASKDESLEFEMAVVKKVMFQILSHLRDLHSAGVVHRDVKPLNLVLDQKRGSFTLIDLGACVDLRSGYNYAPHETILDPTYAAPEQYVMPTCTPELPPDPLCSLISPLVWLLNSPDRFDLYSTGIILVQLCVKPLRHDPGLLAFNRDLKRAQHDLDLWRERCRLPDIEFALLDADDGAGWELARALLQARPDKESVIWPSLGNARPSALGALRHRFLRRSGFPFPLPRLPTDVIENIQRLLPDSKDGNRDPKVLGGAIFSAKAGGQNGGDVSKSKVPEFVPASPSSTSRGLESLLGGAVLAASRLGRRKADGESLRVIPSPQARHHGEGSPEEQRRDRWGGAMSVESKTRSQSSVGPRDNSPHVPIWAMGRTGTAAALASAATGNTPDLPVQEAEAQVVLITSLKEAAARGNQISSSVGSAVGASWPAAAALIAGWLAWTGLRTSAQMTYELGKGTADSIGLSATAFLAFFLLVKPWLEEVAQAESEEASRRRNADVAVALGDSTTLHKILVKRREQSAAFESLALDEAVQAMHKQMASLEACLASQREYSQEQARRISRLEGLLH